MQNLLRRYTGARLRKDLKTKMALCFCLSEIKFSHTSVSRSGEELTSHFDFFTTRATRF